MPPTRRGRGGAEAIRAPCLEPADPAVPPGVRWLSMRHGLAGRKASGMVEGRSRTMSAADRVLVLFARFIGAGYVGYAIILIPSIRDGWSRFAPWWSVGAVVAVWGAGIAMGVVTLTRKPRIATIRAVTNVAAVGYILAVATVPIGWEGPLYPAGEGLWLTAFPGLPGLAAAIVWSPKRALAYLVVAVGGVQLMHSSLGEPGTRAPLYVEVTFAFMFCLVFVAAAIIAARTGRVIDEVTATSHRAVAMAAAADAREVERERFGALIHDGVMASLLAAARLGAVPEVGTQAESTLDQLDHLGSGAVEPVEYDVDGAIAIIRNAAAAIDQRLDVTVTGNRGGALPGDVVRAVAAATAEAVRNARRHAGPEAACRVEMVAGESALRVSVADDGCGFDPKSVPRHRLGLAVSVHGRMRQIKGAADVVTAPGRGTVVILHWAGA